MGHPSEVPPAYQPPAGGLEDHTSASDTKGDLTHVDSAELTDFVYVPNTEEERKLVRKIDIRLIPMLWVMYILNYVSVLSPSDRPRARVPRSDHKSSRADPGDVRAMRVSGLGHGRP